MLRGVLYCLDMKALGVNVGAGTILQADNDSVYRACDFEVFCKRNGILQRFSAPYTQAQNGVAERMWNTVIDVTRALLIAADLDKQFWGAAVLHAAFLRNLCPSSAVEDRVPYESKW